MNQSLTDDQDVVELLDTIDLRQELVDYGVVHARAAGARASLLADGIQFIKDDDVEAAVGSQLETDSKKEFSVAFFNETYHVKKKKKTTPSVSHPLLLFLCIGEQFADVGFGLSHILVQDLWAVYNLRLTGVEHLADLPGHQCFTTARRSKQQDALHVFTAWNTERRKG